MNKHSIAAALAGLMFVGASSLAQAQETPASLATLSKADGKVMVDKGQGYVSATANTPLNQGDRVITLGGSGAEIVFADGCKSELKENHMMEISAEQGCKAALAKVAPAAAGAGAGASGTPTSQIVGPLVAAGIVVGLTANWEDLDTPISAQ
jgi:hypothetical protein